MSWLWPEETSAEPSALGRAGRVVHWIAILAATPLVALTLWALSEREGDSWPFAVIPLSIAGGIYLTGRAIRYILAGE